MQIISHVAQELELVIWCSGAGGTFSWQQTGT